ncbi:spore germination protein, partial [Bacillus subtilis]
PTISTLLLSQLHLFKRFVYFACPYRYCFLDFLLPFFPIIYRQLPYFLLAILVINRLGIPFCVSVVLFIALFFLEILLEARIRLPSAVSSTVTVV